MCVPSWSIGRSANHISRSYWRARLLRKKWHWWFAGVLRRSIGRKLDQRWTKNMRASHQLKKFMLRRWVGMPTWKGCASLSKTLLFLSSQIGLIVILSVVLKFRLLQAAFERRYWMSHSCIEVTAAGVKRRGLIVLRASSTDQLFQSPDIGDSWLMLQPFIL
jgi:hypothetical protein